MTNEEKLTRHINFLKRLKWDIKLIFHKDKQLDWDDIDYSSEALLDYIDFVLSSYKIDWRYTTKSAYENLKVFILGYLKTEYHADEFYNGVSNYIMDKSINIKLKSET